MHADLLSIKNDVTFGGFENVAASRVIKSLSVQNSCILNIMKIKLNLTKHCIETETRRLYNRSLAQYFKPNADKKQLEARIEMLQNALECLDFGRLRSVYPELAGNEKAHVTLTIDKANQPVIHINGKKIDPF